LKKKISKTIVQKFTNKLALEHNPCPGLIYDPGLTYDLGLVYNPGPICNSGLTYDPGLVYDPGLTYDPGLVHDDHIDQVQNMGPLLQINPESLDPPPG